MKFKKKGISLHVSDVKYFALTIIYYLLLDAVYVMYISPRYGYYHFGLDVSLGAIICAIIMLIPISLSIGNLVRKSQVSDLAVIFLIYMYFIPYLSYFSLYAHEYIYAFFVFVYFILLIAFDIHFEVKKSPILHKEINFGNTKGFVFFIILCGLITILMSGIYTDFRISFDFSEYYELRAEAREYSMPEVVRYISGWARLGLNVGLCYAIVHKKRKLTLFTVIASVFAFSFNGKKSVMFITILIVLISYFYKEFMIKKIGSAFLGLTLSSIIEMFVRGGDSFLAKHFIRRMLFIPPMMGSIYYDFFSEHELDYLRASILRRFGFASPYGKIARYIGSVYFGGGTTLAFNANTGLCGDAYANFGFASILVFPLAVILVFKMIEKCCVNADRKVCIVVAVILAYSYVSGAFFTLLLTNGILFLGFLLATLNDKKVKLSKA